MTDEQALRGLYDELVRCMIFKDVKTLDGLMTEDAVLIHMTGLRQTKADYLKGIADGTFNYYSAQTDSVEVTVSGDSARLIGRSRISAAVYGGGRHTWRLQMDSQCIREDGRWKLQITRASTY